MGINPWLDKFNKAKKQVNRLRVRTFCYENQRCGSRLYYQPSKPIAVIVEWDNSEFGMTPAIEGVEIYDTEFSHNNIKITTILWTEEFPAIILKDTTLRVDFSKMKIQDKWFLEDMLEEDDCE
jgi:hypothetical protein